jgi:nitroreductase
MHRRSFLKGAGAATVLVATGGGWRALAQGVFREGAGPAYQPWSDWRRGPDETLLPMVRAAILAANPHNSQPWLFKVTDAAIELFLDARRDLGALDPYRREAYIGLGCALENLVLAAKAKGTQLDITLVPGRLGLVSPGPGPVRVGQVVIGPCIQEWTDLYEAIPRRHTNRSPLLPRKPVPPEFAARLNHLVDEREARLFLFTGEAERGRIVAASSAANAALGSDPAILRVNDRWLRLRWDEVQAQRDGLTVDGFGLSPVAAAFAKMMPGWMLRRAVRDGAKRGYADRLASAPLMGIIAVRDRLDRVQSLLAGRIWERAHLLATTFGLAGRPCNEAVEWVDHEQALGLPTTAASPLAELLGEPGWEPTFVFCIGYPSRPAHASPRRPVEQVLL